MVTRDDGNRGGWGFAQLMEDDREATVAEVAVRLSSRPVEEQVGNGGRAGARAEAKDSYS